MTVRVAARLAPTSWAGSPSAWPRRRPGCGGAGCERAAASTCRAGSRSRRPIRGGRRSSAFYLPMHTATRLAAPVIARVRRAESRRRGSARTGSTRRSTPTGCARSASMTCSAASSRRTSRRWRAIGLSGGRRVAGSAASRRGTFRADSLSGARSARPAAARAVRDAADAGRHAPIVGYTEASRGCKTSVPALPDRARLRRPVPRRAARGGARGHRRAGRRGRRSTSPSAIPISSTARPRDAHRRGAPRRASGGHLRRDDQGRAPAAASRPAAAACATPAALFVTSAVESVDDACWRGWTRDIRARISSRRSRCAAPPA